jgi:hypothetical protein
MLASKVSVNRKVMRKVIRKATMNLPSPFYRNGGLMRAGTMPRSLTRAEDGARAEAFAKRIAGHYRFAIAP